MRQFTLLVGAKVCDLTEDLLWFVCGLYVGILTSISVCILNLTSCQNIHSSDLPLVNNTIEHFVITV